ncbi:hypothetical protein CIPAW_15G156300 [Carya illinoinensis]|uniref:Trans-cinnamate 4-monooxygenase n=1 Tax=Carya illinoinensis TaxID=32201 RepID=A0A8T1N7X8_CARIL|nr:hypothetical protein CIPAW_15G156300 [Carya illinoinensis]KAG6676213.1 hypothetical protein I3842_15G140600 [Carya illinoinensis]
MAHLLAKSIFYSTLVAAILISVCKLVFSHFSIPFSPVILPLLPFILYYLNSISNPPNTTLPPGPLCVPILGNWLQVGNDLNHRLLATMAQTYGPVFLLKLGSKNLAMVSNPELANQVLHTQGIEFDSCPSNVIFDIFTGSGQDMVFTIYGDHWRKMHRIMTLPFFTNKVVHQHSDMWEEEMDLVVHDLIKDERLMLYNVMYRMMFDAKFESQEDPLLIEATRLNSERSRLAQSFEYNYGDFIPLLRPFLRGYLNRCRDLHSRRLAFLNKYFVEKRRKIMAANGEKHKISCAIDHIIDAQMKGEISEENVLYIVENINVAAIETTLWFMEWAIADIRDEILTILKGQVVTESNLHELPYLQATVKETLRLHTPIPLLGGYTIPKESKVVVNAWWLPTTLHECCTDALASGKVDFQYLPFGMGRRSCPGIILALPILGLVIAKLVCSFEMRTEHGIEKIDVSEKGGQFSLHIANHSIVIFDPVTA